MSNVSHPKHYNQGKIEVIEFIEDKGLNFHRGNAVKYIARAGIKDPFREIEDLEKARWYIDREIEVLKAKADNAEPRKPNDMKLWREVARKKYGLDKRPEPLPPSGPGMKR